jgi:DNA repair exonuclease SbcCD nuclease subunit
VKALRFLHTADWQIGMKAAHVGPAGAAVREERLAAAKRVVEIARQQRAEFVLVAGDTFEDNAVDRVLVQRVADILGAASCAVFVIPGNHDPLVPGSVWEHAAWASFPHVRVLAEPQPIVVPGGLLYPCPLKEKHSPGDPTRWIDAAGESRVAVGLAHGTVEGLAQDELDYPVARTAAARGSLDYLAIGHWHSTATYPDASGAIRMAYSGTHETTKFGERDSGNVLIVEIAARGAPPQLTPVRTGGLAWKTLEPALREAGDLARAVQLLETLEEPSKTLLDLRLTGVLYPSEQAQLVRLRELAAARFCYARLDTGGLVPPPDAAWLDELPAGLLREVALELRTLAHPARPRSAEQPTPEIAARSLLELYRLLQETPA